MTMNLTYPKLRNNTLQKGYNFKPFLTFQANGSQELPVDTVLFNTYKNRFPKKLKATINPNLKEILRKDPTVHDLNIANKRLTSFSKYLKETMVGFITPEGEHWFEGACKYLILATAGVPVKESRYEYFAKEFWTLMANTDNYWSSNEFISYLKTMNQEDPGVKATLSAIKQLNQSTKANPSMISFTSSNKSTLTRIKELIDNGCAYTGEKFSELTQDDYPYIELLFSESSGGESVKTESNYILVNKFSKSRIGIPLTEFLKGWNGIDFEREYPDWKDKKGPFVEYKNHLSLTEREKQTSLNIDFKNSLINDENYNVHDLDKALDRIQSLSRYLKEEMVGFITPSGKEWFEGACEYLIKGTAGTFINESRYEEHAKSFWGLMAKADSYWASQKFLNYLNTLEKNTGVNATINVIKTMVKENKARNSQVSFGYTSQLRFIPELLKSSAFSNTPMNLTKNDPQSASVDHIFPNSMGGDGVNDDCNYLLITDKENSSRGNLSIMQYLMGWDAIEYEKEHPGWQKRRAKRAKQLLERM